MGSSPPGGGAAVADVVGFLFGLVAPFPAWRWWFRSMMREARLDREGRRSPAAASTTATSTPASAAEDQPLG